MVLSDSVCYYHLFFKIFKETKGETFFMFITTSVICISKFIPSWAYSWFFGKYLCLVNVPTTHKATGTRVNRPQQCLDPCLNTWLPLPHPRNVHYTGNNTELRRPDWGQAIWNWGSHLMLTSCVALITTLIHLLIFSTWQPRRLN